MPRSYWVETLGCPKNQVDSDKLEGTLLADGLEPATEPDHADVIVVNTCAFIEEARQESINTILALAEGRRPGARLVVTGCMAERYGDELAEALPEVDLVAPFGASLTVGSAAEVGAATASAVGVGVPVRIGRKASSDPGPAPAFDLLNLPRPAARRPWAYVKVAEGCDRNCGFCAIPSFRGKQRSRSLEDIVAEVDGLGVSEIVLVAQDLASFGRDQGKGERSLVPLLGRLEGRVPWIRLLYLYPSDLTDALVDAICATDVPYFDLSLQHVSAPLLRRMRRWGDGERFLERIASIRARRPEAAFRTNFIVGYPGETEADHEALLEFVEEAQLDWCGFFAYSPEEGTYATTLDGEVPAPLRDERLGELRELQDEITAQRRDALIGTELRVLVDEPGVGRSFREAPEIDGIVELPSDIPVGSFATVRIVDALGPDLVAERVQP
ncbi:MAG: 30S ribosomal protein S12 methylthiotransferase RimO [Acidimicrobiales bacterium]|nr:30S ribosomal protein S12 methylthiotransferase RimO [Acidimicrobiales bacterium]